MSPKNLSKWSKCIGEKCCVWCLWCTCHCYCNKFYKMCNFRLESTPFTNYFKTTYIILCDLRFMEITFISDMVYVHAVTVLAFLSWQHSRTKYNAGTGKQAIEIANLCRGPLRFVSDLCLRQLGLSTNSFVYF